MITITTNINQVASGLIASLTSLANPDTVSRAVATALLPEIRERIHVRGENSNGAQIGTYQNSYLRIREKKFNRTPNSDVVLSLTRQLENSYVLEASDKGYTIGVASPESARKINWLEEKYGKVWSLTKTEQEQAQKVAEATTIELLRRTA